MLPGSSLPPRSSGLNDPVLEIIRRTRDDRYFTNFLFDIILFEFAACTETHKPMVPLHFTLLRMAWNYARSVLSKFDKLASASKEYSRVAGEVPEDAGGENFMSLFELQVATAPFAFSIADLRLYLHDPLRTPYLVTRDLALVDLPGMSEDYFALRALTAADHEHYWTFYNKHVNPKFQDRYSAIVFGLRELWGDVGTGGWSVTLIEPNKIKGVEKYSRKYNVNKMLKERGLAPLPPLTSSPSKVAPSSPSTPSGKVTPVKSSTPALPSVATTLTTTTTSKSTPAVATAPVTTSAKTTSTATTTTSKDKISARPALADTQVSKGPLSKPALASTTTDNDGLENNEEIFKVMVHEWKKTLDETNTRLCGVRVRAFLDCDFSEEMTRAMMDFSSSQLTNIRLFADVFNQMLVRRDHAVERGRQRLIREYSARKPNTKNSATATALSEVAPSTSTVTTTTSFADTPSFPNRKIATARKSKVVPKDAPAAAHQATNGAAVAATAQDGLRSMQDQEDSDTDSDLPDLLDSDTSDGTDSDLPDLLDSGDDGSGTDSDLPDLLDSDSDSETDDDLPDLLDSDVEVEVVKSNGRTDDCSDLKTESNLPDLLDSDNEAEKKDVDVAKKHSAPISDLPDYLDSDEPKDPGTDSDLPDLLESEPDVSALDSDNLLDASEDDDDDDDYVFSESDSETGLESSGNASEDEKNDPYGTKLVDTLPAYLTEAYLARNTRLWTEKIAQQYLDKALSGISAQGLAASRERDLAYLYLCDLRLESTMDPTDIEDEDYSPSDEGDDEGVSTEYSDDDEADMVISDAEEDALIKDYNNMDEDVTLSVLCYLENERQLETAYEWSELYERRLQDPEGTLAQTQHERTERIERVVKERTAIAEEMESVAREKAEQERQERLALEKADQERLAHAKTLEEKVTRENAELEERLAREKAEIERMTRKALIDTERLEREVAAQIQRNEQERSMQQTRGSAERYIQESAEQRAREQFFQQQELQIRTRQELNAALEQPEKLEVSVVPSTLSDGAIFTQPQPSTSTLSSGDTTSTAFTPTLEASPLIEFQEHLPISQADVNEEEDDSCLLADAQEWPVEESELVGEAVANAEVNGQQHPRLNESTMWPRGRKIYYNLRGIDFSLALWRSPGLAFNLMEKEVKEWYPLLIASPEETSIRHHLVQRLQALFDAKFPGQGLIIRPFGSYVTGLGDNNSDVDMCVYSDFFKPQAVHSDVSFLASWLRNECQMFEVNAITDAKVPIVKFVDSMTSIHCDLNVQHPLGITNSELIRSYIDIDERLPVFLMLLKYFAKCHSILDASQGYLCSYALTLMGIVFFQEQENPILPRLQSKLTCPKSGKRKSLGTALSEGSVQPQWVFQAGQRFDCTFDTRLAKYRGYGRSNKKPVAQLLYEFFEFFCRKFDYRTMEVNSQMGQFRERNAVARQKKVQLAQERSAGFKTRHTGTTGFVYDGDRHVWMSAEEQMFIMNQEAAGLVPRSARPYPPDHAPEFQGSPNSNSINGMSGNSSEFANSGRYQDRFGNEPFLCVMDPFITNRNVAGTCRGEKLAKVWRSFDHAYKHLAMGDLDGAFCTPPDEMWNSME